jgi:hypothetical protein
MEDVLSLLEPLAALAVRYPRFAGGASVALGVLLVVGTVSAQIDADKLEAQGHPTAAKAVRWGQRLGALAVALAASRKERAK